MGVAVHIKATREDWLTAARALLVAEGVGGLKVLTLAARLGVSRSSFYWYFKNREELLAAVLAHWEAQNTSTLEEYCGRDASSINASLCNFFRCFVNPALFDQGLDFAIRAWARQDPGVRAAIDAADVRRLAAAQEMFERHGFAPDEADIRARIVYFQQLGYHALDQTEDVEDRLRRVTGYLKGFSGIEPTPEEVADFAAYARKVAG